MDSVHFSSLASRANTTGHPKYTHDATPMYRDGRPMRREDALRWKTLVLAVSWSVVGVVLVHVRTGEAEHDIPDTCRKHVLEKRVSQWDSRRRGIDQGPVPLSSTKKRKDLTRQQKR